MKYITAVEYAERNGISRVTVRQQCQRGSIPGAMKQGRDWFVPEDATPIDRRVTTGNYIGKHHYDKYIKPKRLTKDEEKDAAE